MSNLLPDPLKECAKSFEKLEKINYIFLAGRNGRQFQLDLKCLQQDFTHISGLEHLSDIKLFTSHNHKRKISAFSDILNNNITYKTLQTSSFFSSPFPYTFNTTTNQAYTLTDRINLFIDVEAILDRAYEGNIIRWNKDKCRVKMPNESRYRNVSIEADYLLVMPSTRNKDEQIYFFGFAEKPIKIGEPIKLNVHSAFADCVDLTQGQERGYTILQETKINSKTNQRQILYTHPSYQKQLVQAQLSELSRELQIARTNFALSSDETTKFHYQNLQENFARLADESKEYKFAKNLLKEQLKNISDTFLVSKINDDINAVQDKQNAYELSPRTMNITINHNNNQKQDINAAIAGVGSIPLAVEHTKSINIPIPPKRPIKALAMKVKRSIDKFVDSLKKKPEIPLTGTSEGSSTEGKQMPQTVVTAPQIKENVQTLPQPTPLPVSKEQPAPVLQKEVTTPTLTTQASVSTPKEQPKPQAKAEQPKPKRKSIEYGDL